MTLHSQVILGQSDLETNGILSLNNFKNLVISHIISINMKTLSNSGQQLVSLANRGQASSALVAEVADISLLTPVRLYPVSLQSYMSAEYKGTKITSKCSKGTTLLLDVCLCLSVINAVRTHREEIGVKVQQGHEHEHQQDPTTQLHVLLGRTLSHGGDSCKHALSFRTRLGQQQKQPTSEGKVSGRRERRQLF